MLTDLESGDIAVGREPVALGAWLVLFFATLVVGGAVVWAVFAEFDRVVVARGRTVTDNGLLVVQPLNRSIVKEIRVKEGDLVQAGDALIVLDSTFAGADVAELKSRIGSLAAEIRRLKAEVDGAQYPGVEADWTEEDRIQEKLFRERMNAYRSTLREYEQKQKKAEASLEQARNAIRILADRLNVNGEIERMHNEMMVKEKDSSRLQWLRAQDTRLDVEVDLQRNKDSIASMMYEIETMRAERESFERNWFAEATGTLVEAQREHEKALQDLRKAELESQLVSLVATEPAVVLDIADISVGAVVKEAQTLIRLVPAGAPLEIEAEVRGDDIAYLELGLPVTVKLDSLPYVKHGILRGALETISEDSFPDDERNQETFHYTVRASIDQIELRNTPQGFRLLPGMPLSAEIKIGARSAIEYVLHPIMRGLSEVGREP